MSILLNPELIILFIEDVFFLGFNTLALYLAFNIQRYFNVNDTTPLQYRLEKQTYLVSTIIRFSLTIKIISFAFFIFSLDQLSNIIPGAMCAVGVTNASPYGLPTLIIKLFCIYLFGFWLMIDREDRKTEDYKYTVGKFRLYIVIYVFYLLELIYQYLYITDIDPEALVSCCGTVFSAANTSFTGNLLTIPTDILLPVFYTLFALVIWTGLRKDILLFGITNLLFLLLGILSLISFFSTYVYELPSHQCPFCLLQSDYHYVGYLIYILLLSGTFFGLVSLFLSVVYKVQIKVINISISLNTAFLIVVSAYPVFYFLKNGVWL